MIEQSFIVGILLDTKSRLHSVRNLAEVARTRMREEAFGRSFCRLISEDIEEAGFLLDHLVQLLSVNPLKKRGTVQKLIEELLKKYQGQLDEKEVRLSRKYEKDLPETTVPDDPLRYILDSVLQYAIRAVPSGGEMEFSAKSLQLQKDVWKHEKGYIHIELIFKSSQKQNAPVAETASFEEPFALMLLRLAREVVRENQGSMSLKKDKTHGRLSLSLRFPSERRDNVYYRPIHSLINWNKPTF